MIIQIHPASGAVYNLPESFAVIDDPLERRESTEDLAFTHGGQDLSDGKYRQRIVVMTGSLAGVDDSSFGDKLNDIRQAFGEEDFKLVLTGLGKYINVKRCINFNTTFGAGGMYRYTDDMEIELLCTDPFWYSMTETTITQANQAGTDIAPDTFTITNSGNYMTRPVITITSNAAANNDITLTNTTDNNDAFNYSDPIFDATDAVEIDPAYGTVTATKAAVESTTIEHFAGRFPRLLRGANAYEFVGKDSDVKFVFREAYL